MHRTSLAIALAGVFAASAAAAATVTHPHVAGIKECDAPTTPEGGHTKFAFTVTAAGAVTGMRVVESSGNEASDARAAKCMAGYTWAPATRDGVPVDADIQRVYNFPVRIGDLAEGPRKAFHVLERDADTRCRRLFPIDRRFDLAGQPITLVTVERTASGEIQTKVMQSAGEKADAKAVKCVIQLVKEHDDLPATFIRTIAVDWSHG